jgi:hypothetical protein
VKVIVPDVIRKYPAANPADITMQAKTSPMIQGRICFPFPVDVTGAGDEAGEGGVAGASVDGRAGGSCTGGTGCGSAGTGGL